MIGKLLCKLGFHSWITARAEADGEPYLECRRCGAYGDIPPRAPFA
jgi:hypothetical protein